MAWLSVSQFEVHVGLQPPVDGVASELWAMFVDPVTGEDVAFNTTIPIPLSVGGSIDFAATVGVPTSYRFFLFIPAQTVGGVSYMQAQTSPWLGSMSIVNQIIGLEEVVVPPGNGNGVIPVGNLGLIVVAAVALALISQR